MDTHTLISAVPEAVDSATKELIGTTNTKFQRQEEQRLKQETPATLPKNATPKMIEQHCLCERKRKLDLLGTLQAQDPLYAAAREAMEKIYDVLIPLHSVQTYAQLENEMWQEVIDAQAKIGFHIDSHDVIRHLIEHSDKAADLEKRRAKLTGEHEFYSGIGRSLRTQHLELQARIAGMIEKLTAAA